MGRPINKRYLGEPSASNDELKVAFHDGAALLDGWIVKQLGARRFRCTADGIATTDCKLVATVPAAEGEMSIKAKDDAGVVQQVIKISGRKLTLADGSPIGWTFDDSTTDERVEVEEAGNAAAIIAVTAAVAATEYEIVDAGDTDFTLIGAADSNPGTVFTATGPGVGTGTIAPTALVADAF